MSSSLISDREGAVPEPCREGSYQQRFDSHDTLYRWNTLAQVFCVGVPTLLIVLRTYVRASIHKDKWVLEDWFSILSYFSVITYSAILTTLFHKQGGSHVCTVSQLEYESILYWVNIGKIWYGPASSFVKTTILMLFLRVFCPDRISRLRYLIYGLIAVINLFYLAHTLAKILLCLPRAKIWRSELEGHCIDLALILIVSGAFNTISDVAILLAPVPTLWRMKLSVLRKIGIYTLFTVGSIGPIFAIIGFVQRLRLAGDPDQSYVQPEISLWANAELAAGMIIICLPVLPGLRHRFGKSRAMRRPNQILRMYMPMGRQGMSNDENLADRFFLNLENGSRCSYDVESNFKTALCDNEATMSRPEQAYIPVDKDCQQGTIVSIEKTSNNVQGS